MLIFMRHSFYLRIFLSPAVLFFLILIHSNVTAAEVLIENLQGPIAEEWGVVGCKQTTEGIDCSSKFEDLPVRKVYEEDTEKEERKDRSRREKRKREEQKAKKRQEKADEEGEKAEAFEEKLEWDNAYTAWERTIKFGCPGRKCGYFRRRITQARLYAASFKKMLAEQKLALKYEKNKKWREAMEAWKSAIENCRAGFNCSILRARLSHAQFEAQFAEGALWADRKNWPMASQAYSKARGLCGDSWNFEIDCKKVNKEASRIFDRLQQMVVVDAARAAERRKDYLKALKYWEKALDNCHGEEECKEIRSRLLNVRVKVETGKAFKLARIGDWELAVEKYEKAYHLCLQARLFPSECNQEQSRVIIARAEKAFLSVPKSVENDNGRPIFKGEVLLDVAKAFHDYANEIRKAVGNGFMTSCEAMARLSDRLAPKVSDQYGAHALILTSVLASKDNPLQLIDIKRQQIDFSASGFKQAYVGSEPNENQVRHFLAHYMLSLDVGVLNWGQGLSIYRDYVIPYRENRQLEYWDFELARAAEEIAKEVSTRGNWGAKSLGRAIRKEICE